MSMLTPPGLGAPRRKPNWRFLLPVGAGILAVIGLVAWLVVGGDSAPADKASPSPSTTNTTISQTTSRTPSPTTPSLPQLSSPLPAMAIDVRVFNASDRSGLALKTADELSACKFHVLEFGNDPLNSDGKTAATIRYGKRGLTSALSLSSYIPGSALQEDKQRSNSSIDLVLGQAFPGLTPPTNAQCR